MEQSTPFVKKKVTCPLCTKEAFQHALPPNQFSVEEKDSDQHPVKLKWYNIAFQNIQPHHYALFHCPYCYFTDFEENFCNQQTIPNMIALQKVFFEKNPLKDKLLRFLNNKINYDKMTFESVFSLHLSALFIYELEQNEKFKDIKKLSRLYHRIGWLFREQGSTGVVSTGDSSLKEINYNLDLFNTQYQELIKKSKPLYESIKRRVIDLGINTNDPQNPYTPYTQNLEKIYQELDKTISGLRLMTTKDKQAITSTQADSSESSDKELISKVAEVWTLTPINENTALTKAAENYEKIYLKVSATDSLGQQLGVLNILLDLYIRIENFDKASEYLNSLYKFCSESRAQLFSRKSSDPRAEAQIAKLSDTMETLSDRRKEILAKKTEFFRPIFEKIMQEHKNEPWEQVKASLFGNNIPEDVIMHLHDEGDEDEEDEDTDSDDAPTKPKKKFLGLF